jgi:hypothetical protein
MNSERVVAQPQRGRWKFFAVAALYAAWLAALAAAAVVHRFF